MYRNKYIVYRERYNVI